MAMENEPFEDVFPIENGDFPLLCLITGVYHLTFSELDFSFGGGKEGGGLLVFFFFWPGIMVFTCAYRNQGQQFIHWMPWRGVV